MANDRGLVGWEHQPLHDATIEDLDLEKFKAYLARRSANTRQTSRLMDIERVLHGMECVVKTSDNEVVQTNAGMLFFGSHRRRFSKHHSYKPACRAYFLDGS